MNPVGFLNKAYVQNFLDTPTFQRHAFGSLIVTNGLLRPAATMRDKSASEQERRYSAARELFHQTMCFISHYSLAANFEKLAFHLGKQFPALQKEFGEFQTFQQVKAARQYNADARKHNRLIAAKIKDGLPLVYKNIPRPLLGVLRAGDSMGTILALTCIAPILNNLFLKPTLKLFKLEPVNPRKEEPLVLPQMMPTPNPENNWFYQVDLNPTQPIQPIVESNMPPFDKEVWAKNQTSADSLKSSGGFSLPSTGIFQIYQQV